VPTALEIFAAITAALLKTVAAASADIAAYVVTDPVAAPRINDDTKDAIS
jgi:hypothetical protein